MIFGSFSVKLIFKRPKKVGRCWQVGSDKERPKGRVGSGSDNARGSTILNHNNFTLQLNNLGPKN